MASPISEYSPGIAGRAKEVSCTPVAVLCAAILSFAFQAPVRGDSLAGVSACTYYASPVGGGDGKSLSTPFGIGDFWPLAKPGDTLCLLDGTYRDTLITPPANLAGNSDAPITVRALFDGKVLLDGEGKRQPVRLWFNDWFVLEGLNACCSTGTVVEILRSNHVAVRRVAAWDAAEGNNSVFGVHYGDYNLLEDVAGWGIARKIYESSQGGDFTTIRRAWGRWEGSHVGGPKMTYSLAYNNYDMLIENSIGTWSGEKMKETYVLLNYGGQPCCGTYTNFAVNQPYGIFSADGLAGDKNARARLLGSLAYIGQNDVFKADREIFVTNIDSAQLKDTAAIFAPRGTYAGKYTFGLFGLAGGQSNAQALNLTSITADSLGVQIANSWWQANIFQSADTTGFKSLQSTYEGPEGANLCNQYVDGTLSDRPLWPWSMNRRISDAMIQSGHAALDVTATVNQLLGSIPPNCLSAELTIPVAARIKGAGETEFFTDLHISNPADEPARAQLIFQDSASDQRWDVSLRIGPRQTLNFPDVVSSVFGQSEMLGTLKLETDSNGPNTLRMTSRTYTKGSAGSFGESIPGVTNRTPPTQQSTFVTGLAVTDGLRSNLGAVNTAATPETFRIILWGNSGTIVGTSPTQHLAPGFQLQWSVKTLFPTALGKGLAAEFRPDSGSTAPLSYGSVVDNFSGDPTYYSGMRPAPVLYLPSVAHVAGISGSFFRSDVSVTNASSLRARVTVTFLEHDRDNTSAASTTLTIPPYQTRQMDDALFTLFGVTGTYGALKFQVSGSSGILVSERIYTPSSATGGTVGQQIDAVQPENLFSRGSLLGLRQDSAFRTNVGLFNPNSSWAALTLTLLTADGVPLATSSLLVPPLGCIQRSLPEFFDLEPFPAGSSLTVSVDAGSKKIFAFATTVDNASNDPTFSPGLF